MNKTITTDEIYNIVSEIFDTNLKYNSRKTKYTTARFTFYDLSRKYTGDILRVIGNKTGHKHDTVLNGLLKIKNLMIAYTDVESKYKRCEAAIKEKLGIKDDNEPEEEVLRESEEYVLNALKELSDSDVSEFIETRLNPYLNMLKSKQVHKIEVVRGATMNRFSKVYD